MKVIHTGDTHLGYRQYHNEERRRDFVRAFDQVVSDAIDLGVDAVVHAGDLFDNRTPSLEDILDCVEVLQRLLVAGIPFLSIVGNHESKHGMQWLDLFQDLGLARRLSEVPMILSDVAFYGVDSVPRSRIPDFDSKIFAPSEASCNVLVMHQLFKPFPHGVWDVTELLREIPMRVDALLLGDNHKREVERIEGAWVTYCGSTERTSDADREPRSYNLISFDEEVRIERRLIETRNFVYLDSVDVTQGYETVFERLRERELEGRVVVVEIVGSPTVSVSHKEIEEFIKERGAIVSRVKDRRKIEENIGEHRVQFTDPDRAVRERIEELGLSEAARMLDEIVRGNSPKSGIRGDVEARVRAILDRPEAFNKREQHEEVLPAQEVRDSEPRGEVQRNILDFG